MKKIECFKINVINGKKDSLFDLDLSNTIKVLSCDSVKIFREPKTIIADPFLFVHNNVLFLFFEDKFLYKNGSISMIKTKDLVNWSEPVTVLKESCHLSFPYVFEEGGHLYMIPETSMLHSVRLYEASDSTMSHFEYRTTLLNNDKKDNRKIDFSDSSIYKSKDIFYLTTTINRDKENELKLFYSKTLFGPYYEHPNSPVCISNKYGRNAGCLFSYKGELFRPAQDCVCGYGDNVHIIKIDELSIDNYKEHPEKEYLFSPQNVFYKNGGHQFNYVEFKDSIIIVTDAKEYHNFLIQRVFQKFKNKFI